MYFLTTLIVLGFSILIVQGQGVNNFGHTVDQITDLEVSGMIAMFDQDCPTGWTEYVEMDGKFPRGSLIADVGLEGGSEEYRVKTFGSGAECCSGTVKSARVGLEWIGEGESTVAVSGNKWVNGNTEVHRPPYKNLVFCKKD